MRRAGIHIFDAFFQKKKPRWGESVARFDESGREAARLPFETGDGAKFEASVSGRTANIR